MCIDYTDLNKACPKDPFALPRIDQIIDSTSGCEILCFLDAYSGYHQIKMALKAQEKTAFITPFGIFCYTSMPFVRPDMRYCFRSGRFRPNPRTKHISVPPRHMTKPYAPDFQQDITTLQIQDTTSHTIGIQSPQIQYNSGR